MPFAFSGDSEDESLNSNRRCQMWVKSIRSLRCVEMITHLGWMPPQADLLVKEKHSSKLFNMIDPQCTLAWIYISPYLADHSLNSYRCGASRTWLGRLVKSCCSPYGKHTLYVFSGETFSEVAIEMLQGRETTQLTTSPKKGRCRKLLFSC